MFRFGTVAAFCLITRAVHAGELGVHEVTVRTVMPHLEESLRYATVHERRCLRADELVSLFPILQHPSLEGCTLAAEDRRADRVGYQLLCASPQVATGAAQLELADGRIAGVLEIKMGGKNMTFTQRIEARRLGECEPPR